MRRWGPVPGADRPEKPGSGQQRNTLGAHQKVSRGGAADAHDRQHRRWRDEVAESDDGKDYRRDADESRREGHVDFIGGRA